MKNEHMRGQVEIPGWIRYDLRLSRKVLPGKRTSREREGAGREGAGREGAGIGSFSALWFDVSIEATRHCWRWTPMART